jgi:glutaredoxin
MEKYWAVMFTTRTAAIDTARMRHYVNWYCTRFKCVELDHHTSGRSLQAQIRAEANINALPILFVNKKLVGTIDDVLRLEEEKKLKDVLQFGFEWQVGGKSLCGPLPSAYQDKELFLGQYVGAPVMRPVTQLPQLHPHLPQR